MTSSTGKASGMKRRKKANVQPPQPTTDQSTIESLIKTSPWAVKAPVRAEPVEEHPQQPLPPIAPLLSSTAKDTADPFSSLVDSSPWIARKAAFADTEVIPETAPAQVVVFDILPSEPSDEIPENAAFDPKESLPDLTAETNSIECQGCSTAKCSPSNEPENTSSKLPRDTRNSLAPSTFEEMEIAIYGATQQSQKTIPAEPAVISLFRLVQKGISGLKDHLGKGIRPMSVKPDKQILDVTDHFS